MVKRALGLIILLSILLTPYQKALAAVPDSGGMDFPDVIFRAPHDFAVTELGNAESVFVIALKKFGYNVEGFITPIFNKEKQIALPVLKPYRELGERFVQYLNPI